MKMNRNMMIGGVVVVVVVIVLLVVFVLGGGDDEDGGDDGGALTSESMTSAFEAMLAGDAEPAKALTCEEALEGIDAAAESFAAVTEAGGEVEVSCEVGDTQADCDLTVAGQSQTLSFEVVDGKICQAIAP